MAHKTPMCVVLESGKSLRRDESAQIGGERANEVATLGAKLVTWFGDEPQETKEDGVGGESHHQNQQYLKEGGLLI